jgi:hypothetical protein
MKSVLIILFTYFRNPFKGQGAIEPIRKYTDKSIITGKDKVNNKGNN